jgi:hypothetical protein
VGAEEEEQEENMFSTLGKIVLAVMTALSSIFSTQRGFTEKEFRDSKQKIFFSFCEFCNFS